MSTHAEVSETAPLQATTTPLVPLEQAHDASRYGHKASVLAALLARGFRVPPGFVLPVGSRPDRTSVEQALHALGAGPVAVRSSGLAEDLADASYAGQYDTVLDVTGVDAVLAAIERCLASATGARVEAYEGGAAHGPHGMAVLIQTLVPARSAGVAFSANPLTGDRQQVVISATRGLGDRLVGGEIDGDEWCVAVADGAAPSASAVVEPQHAIDATGALEIAELARRVEAARGAPQDIEWAFDDAGLHLLQARPITALPVAPVFEAPLGTWEKDSAHFPDPVCPFAATTHLNPDVMRDLIPDIGLLPDGISGQVIGHEFYIHVEPDDGGGKPPPWWVIGLVARLHPGMRRKLRRARETVESGWLTEVPERWERELSARQREQLRRFADVDLGALADDGLLSHIRTLARFAGDSMRLHFELFIPHAVGTHELTRACRELLGWDLAQTARLLSGLSTASSAPTRELAEIADLARPRLHTRDLLEAGGPDVLERLAQVDPEVHDRITEHLSFWGLRTYGPDASAPNVADRPELLASSLAALIADGTLPDHEPERQQLIAEARSQLTDAADRRRFDEALAFAELTYPLREDNVIVTDQMVIGLCRIAGLEAGRRLAARGLVRHADDVMMLTVDEIEQHLKDELDAQPLVLRRRAELAYVRAHPGPACYGAPPGPAPSLRGLPAAARRLNEALLFVMEEELSRPRPSEGDAIAGLAASPGVYRGRARVITSVHDLDRLQRGEVLVCPSTTAAWMMVFNKAGALVTDYGSLLTHTSIVAREHRLPAVVATQSATTKLSDGDEIIVDGTQGTVTRVADT